MTSELGGFTPIPHSLAQEVGLVCAAVYGLVWRYCQMKEGVCKASLDKLGSDINIDRATVLRSIKKLCELGYLTDQTPDRRNAPHTYTLLKSVALCNSSTDTDIVMRSDSEAETVAERNKSVAHNNSSISVAERKATVAQSKATVAESYLKKDSKKHLKETTTKEKTPPKGGGKPPPANPAGPESRAMFSALAEVCGLDIKLLTDKDRGALNQAEKIMRENGYKPADLVAFGGWWSTHDWRGKQGDEPTLIQIRETWGRFRKWQGGIIPATSPDPLPPPSLSADETTWAAALHILEGQMTQATYDTIIQGTHLSRENGHYVILAPTEASQAGLRRLTPTITRALASVIGAPADIEVQLLQETR